MTKIQIKPCPFCGSAAQSQQGTPEACFVLCNACGASGPSARNEVEAINKWNDAPRPSVSTSALKFLREDISKLEDAYIAAMPEGQRKWIAAEIAGSDFAALSHITRFFESAAVARDMLLP